LPSHYPVSGSNGRNGTDRISSPRKAISGAKKQNKSRVGSKWSIFYAPEAGLMIFAVTCERAADEFAATPFLNNGLTTT
jgi:hypothetical protein